jgi:hypothetical protein
VFLYAFRQPTLNAEPQRFAEFCGVLMHARLTSAGAIPFDGGPTLSRQQVLLLRTLASQPAEQPIERRVLHRALWPAQIGPLTPGQRAALSRTIYRMERWGIVSRSSSTTV